MAGPKAALAPSKWLWALSCARCLVGRSRPRHLAAPIGALAIPPRQAVPSPNWALPRPPGATPPATTRHAATLPTVVLRMDVGGGFAPFPMSLTSVPPVHALRRRPVILPVDRSSSGDGPSPPLREACPRVGRRPTRSSRWPSTDTACGMRATSTRSIRIADATTTVFTVHADGIDKTVSVYGLGFGDDGPDGRDAAASRASRREAPPSRQVAVAARRQRDYDRSATGASSPRTTLQDPT